MALQVVLPHGADAALLALARSLSSVRDLVGLEVTASGECSTAVGIVALVGPRLAAIPRSPRRGRRKVPGLGGRLEDAVIADEVLQNRNEGFEKIGTIQHTHHLADKVARTMGSISALHKWCLTGTPVQTPLEDLGSLVSFLEVPLLKAPSTFRKYICRGEKTGEQEFNNYENLAATSSGNLPPAKLVSIAKFRCKQLESGYRNARAALANAKKDQEVVSKPSNRSIVAPSNVLQQRHQSEQRTIPSGLQASPARRDTQLVATERRGHMRSLQLGDFYFELAARLRVPDPMLSPHMLNLFISNSKRPQRPRDSEVRSMPSLSWERGLARLLDTSTSTFTKGRPTTNKNSSCGARHPDVPEDWSTTNRYTTFSSLVFSFWKATLNILQQALEVAGIKCLRADGDIPCKERDERISQISYSPAGVQGPAHHILSTGAYGIERPHSGKQDSHPGASVENPAVGNQAIGRVLRVDRGRKVTVIRCILKKSVEELVQSRQHHKLLLAKGGFTSGVDTGPGDSDNDPVGLMDTSR
ncbi:hypothetical protein MKZ38_007077 [Zalerion maritima]|uniref:SNF2 N-terminal domain-containing protein n=1 Tax=Zalerion maritima TaxID=339359 RepID=A0AAD5WPF1_9PEZI|nr:hypothetical protein MKZ38_007077 [Zalerion maritima]